jgi:hypothetical protein
LGIPVLVWGSPNQYGDPQTKMGCPCIDSKTMMATARCDDGDGGAGDGATGYDDNNDDDWQ